MPSILLAYTRRVMHRIAFFLVIAIGACGQDPPADPAALRFEVASLKASPAGGRGGGIRPAPGGERYLGNNVSLQVLMMVAYRVKADQIVGGPGWTLTEGYDLTAKA